MENDLKEVTGTTGSSVNLTQTQETGNELAHLKFPNNNSCQ